MGSDLFEMQGYSSGNVVYLCVFEMESAGWVDGRDEQDILRQALKIIQHSISSHATMTNLARESYLSNRADGFDVKCRARCSAV